MQFNNNSTNTLNLDDGKQMMFPGSQAFQSQQLPRTPSLADLLSTFNNSGFPSPVEDSSKLDTQGLLSPRSGNNVFPKSPMLLPELQQPNWTSIRPVESKPMSFSNQMVPPLGQPTPSDLSVGLTQPMSNGTPFNVNKDSYNVQELYARQMMSLRMKRLPHLRKASRNEVRKTWTRRETVLLLQCASIMLHCELKEITQVLSSRLYNKHTGRAAEKKLKRLINFQNWKSSNKTELQVKIAEKLRLYNSHECQVDTEMLRLARSVRPGVL